MKKIGILFGMENSFPPALVEHINARNIDGIEAEFVRTGAVHLDKAPDYAVIVDRISHDIPFYRAFLKHAALNGTVIINNPSGGRPTTSFSTIRWPKSWEWPCPRR